MRSMVEGATSHIGRGFRPLHHFAVPLPHKMGEDRAP